MEVTSYLRSDVSETGSQGQCSANDLALVTTPSSDSILAVGALHRAALGSGKSLGE